MYCHQVSSGIDKRVLQAYLHHCQDTTGEVIHRPHSTSGVWSSPALPIWLKSWLTLILRIKWSFCISLQTLFEIMVSQWFDSWHHWKKGCCQELHWSKVQATSQLSLWPQALHVWSYYARIAAGGPDLCKSLWASMRSEFQQFTPAGVNQDRMYQKHSLTFVIAERLNLYVQTNRRWCCPHGADPILPTFYSSLFDQESWCQGLMLVSKSLPRRSWLILLIFMTMMMMSSQLNVMTKWGDFNGGRSRQLHYITFPPCCIMP